MVEFIIGLAIGTVVTSIVFIVWGKNNQKSINAAREEIVGVYNKVGAEAREVLERAEKLLKK